MSILLRSCRVSTLRWAERAMLARIWSALLVQVKGLGWKWGVDELGDGTLQFVHAAVRPTPDLLGGQFREPAFHQVQPGAVGG
jgi:hypothetical protein